MAEDGAGDGPREPLRLQVLEKMSALFTAAFGLVAALAWNDAVKSTIEAYVAPDTQLRGMYLYAVLITALAVLVSLWIAAAVTRVKKRMARARGEGHKG